jgi:hypothetical protein
MTTFAKHYPMRVITELLGIPRQDEDKMAAWAKAMLNSVVDPEGTERANAEFTEYVAPLVAERRSRPGDDLLSAIVNEEVEGQRLDEDHVFGFLRLLFPAGVDTSSSAAGRSGQASFCAWPRPRPTTTHGRLTTRPVGPRPATDEPSRLWPRSPLLPWRLPRPRRDERRPRDPAAAPAKSPAGRGAGYLRRGAARPPIGPHAVGCAMTGVHGWGRGIPKAMAEVTGLRYSRIRLILPPSTSNRNTYRFS